MEKFNQIGDIFKNEFPNINILCNEVKPRRFEQFDVYIRGVLTKDPENVEIYSLFKNFDTIATLIKQFNWKMANIYDNLCLIISEFLNFTKDMGDF